jgi:hypothetical protein
VGYSGHIGYRWRRLLDYAYALEMIEGPPGWAAPFSLEDLVPKRLDYCVQTFMVFMPVSASVLVLKVPLSTMVVVVVVGLLSTTVHFS